jgi:hypothetical protein
VPPPCAVLDPSHRARHYLVPNLGACRRHNPTLRVHRHHVPNSEHAAAILFLKLIVIDLATIVDDLDPIAFGLCLPSTPPPGCRQWPSVKVTPLPSLISEVCDSLVHFCEICECL